MNFMEAVAEMRKGNKVRRLTQHKSCRCYIEDGVVLFINGEMSMPTTFDMFKPDDYEANDWEVFEDDKDWNLADQKDSDEDIYFTDVKKCRDLIIKKNFEKAAGSLFIPLIDVKKIINETFGDL